MSASAPEAVDRPEVPEPCTNAPSGRGGISGPRTLSFHATVTLCHAPSGTPGRGTTMTSYIAALGHAKHGDVTGVCP